MIDPSNVDGYESNDSEYATELWEYHREALQADEVLDIIADSFAQSGIEALEQEALHGFSMALTEYRPPVKSQRTYHNQLLNCLEFCPPRLALNAWQSELETWREPLVQDDIFSKITVLEVGEEMFDVDLTDEIVEELQHMDECESKLDMLEDRGGIDSQEWVERTRALEIEEEKQEI